MQRSVIAITIILFALVALYFYPISAGFCSELAIWRYKFSVYACEYNDEASGFGCSEKIGNFWNYIGLKKIEIHTSENTSCVSYDKEIIN